MRAALALTCWFFAYSRNFHPAQASDNINYLVPYEEVEETYVEWPQDSASQILLQTRRPDSIPPIKMALWTTAIDFRHPLTHLLLGIVRRLDRELLFFQPRYFLMDGVERGCRSIDSTTGETQETEWDVNNNALFEDCQQNCTNHGRYCAASIPGDPALAAKIHGADIAEESLRRLCSKLDQLLAPLLRFVVCAFGVILGADSFENKLFIFYPTSHHCSLFR